MAVGTHPLFLKKVDKKVKKAVLWIATISSNKARERYRMMLSRITLSSAAIKATSRYIRCASSITCFDATKFNHKNGRLKTKHDVVVNPLCREQQSSSVSSFSSASKAVVAAANSPKKKMIPRKAALHLTPKARDIFRKLIEATSSEGIILKYEMSSQHALRMAFKFDLVKDAKKELSFDDEG